MMKNTKTAARSAFRIEILSHEGPVALDATGTYDSFAAADRALAPLAEANRGRLGYFKVDALITHLPTGDEYRARYDMEDPAKAGAPNLAKWIVSACRFRAETERGQKFLRMFSKSDEEFEAKRAGFAAWAKRIAG